MESLIESRVSKFSWQFVDELKSTVSAEISKNVLSSTNECIEKNILDPMSGHYEKLKELSGQIKNVSSSYGAAATEISSRLTEYYTRTDINLGVLAKVSAAIRQEEIEPSFVTLNERNEELVGTRTTLTEIG